MELIPWSKCWRGPFWDVRVAAQAWNGAGRSEPYCELFFFLMRREQRDGMAKLDREAFHTVNAV